MKRYFTFTDDKSSKFWQIDPSGNAFTVTFGKMGTAGQSQTKTFDTTDRCQQEADKLVREKTNKGYVESVNGVAVSPANGAAPRKPTERRTDPDKEAVEAVLTRYDEIVSNGQLDQLLSFLQGVDKHHYPALRQKIKQAKKYWCDYGVLGTEQQNGVTRQRHGVRGNWHQKTIINLSGMALLPLPDLKGFENLYGLLVGQYSELTARKVLEWAKPTWLTEFLLQQANRGSWTTMPYAQLREMETAGLISYQPELFARSVGVFQENLYDDVRRKYFTNDYRPYLAFVTTDDLVLSRDIPALFEYPVFVHDAFCIVEKKEGKYEGYRMHIWTLIFEHLLANGKLDRLWFLERCLSVQTKDWPINLRAFYRKQAEAANPTPAEWLALQSTLFSLLAAQHPHVVNWAIGIIKDISTEPDFRADEMLDWTSATMMRDDCKTGLKTLLTVFERLLKAQPDRRTAITHRLADVFAINDPSLQTKAAALLTKYGDPTDDDLQTALQTYSGQMLGNVAGDLGQFLNADNAPTAETDGPVAYQYAPPDVPKLVPGADVHLPENWTDLLFLIGKSINSEEPLDIEILMNALLFPPADKPTDFREQLKPYAKKLEKTYSASKISQLTKSYLEHWMYDNGKPYIGIDTGTIQTMHLQRLRWQHLDRKRKSGSRLPLLSLPTHAPHWVDPTTLVRRLLAYGQTGETVEPLDLAIAIARMPRENTAEAIALCGQLDKNVAPLMRYCLGETTTLNLPTENVISRLLTAFQNKNNAGDHLDLWAVAARTVEPDAEFPAFANTAFAHHPNVVRPFVPAYAMQETWHEWQDYATKQTMRGESWQQLTVTLPNRPEPVPTLLYSNDLFRRDKKAYFYFDPHPPDVAFWYSLIPQQPEALFTFVAGYGANVSETEPAITQALTLMFQPGFRFRDMSGLMLGCGLLANKRETRALAAEVLIHHIGERTLDVTRLGDRLGWLLTNDLAPVQRLMDALNLVRDVSPLHNEALRLMLDALFAQFTPLTELPKNTKKLLEIYLDLLIKTGKTPPKTTITLLKQGQTNASLKKLCTDILKTT